jgi:hypothetical protein
MRKGTTEAGARVWTIVCELSDDDARREMAAALLGKRPGKSTPTGDGG